MLVNKVLVFFFLGVTCLEVIYDHAMALVNSWEGWDRILLATSRIPCESVGHLIYFPRFLTRESAERA